MYMAIRAISYKRTCSDGRHRIEALIHINRRAHRQSFTAKLSRGRYAFVSMPNLSDETITPEAWVDI
jgi:hypothetical protein